ncbi:DUF202 domain-containing protein [Comamonas sp. lk]|uniref:DUF202 domain-containing protein n=1 Tax=Comamonas sp. lk TaxID=2201272 RepID=UPI000EAD1DDB|nr:DUF202 domain-containing protein [Comamonas sp. lk]
MQIAWHAGHSADLCRHAEHYGCARIFAGGTSLNSLARPRDPGLQPERTALAWSRTGLAMLLNALLALRSGWVGQHAPITGLGLVLLMASGAIIFYGAWRRRHLLCGHGVVAPSAHAITAVAAVTFLACVVALASAITS